jgi:hypothetical protein
MYHAKKAKTGRKRKEKYFSARLKKGAKKA